ncbi:hypothetical protein OIE69_44345 (plasmid) [Actinacidiphila glaucinigra]|uniref:hypothetical protein n=1 Tax=Actinacidiphila glaucinigra TaxID=235986 RepID=UPI002DD8BCE1|nr:hypothetical protein [Actinacidiphila glaucinigra]WSD65936.1 hypothetical protein OIE69_44345 [Actinacidiphila glaucinigra]
MSNTTVRPAASPAASQAARPDLAPTRVLPRGTLPRITADACTPTQWATAEQKARKANLFLVFIEEGLCSDRFTTALYRTVSGHLFGHIAHFDRAGFADTWFTTPATKAAFIDHALRRRVYGDPAYTWSDVEEHIQHALQAHPGLRDLRNWPGYQPPAHGCPSCTCTR